ncbi:unnamed protein product [Polarella glacialis]|uniref:Uncharacterized protein n=2 Tax=Polarella glacialis TaxID=89957 RepID=A0A813D6F9_POLGL|nr:unnamed protein product [Polarella glacialis]
MCREEISREGDGTVPQGSSADHDERFFDADGQFQASAMNLVFLSQAVDVTMQCCLWGCFDGVWQACFVQMGDICGALCTQVGDGLTSLVAGCCGAGATAATQSQKGTSTGSHSGAATGSHAGAAAGSHAGAATGSHAGAAATANGTAAGGAASSHAAVPAAHGCAAAPHMCLCAAGGLCIGGLLALAVGGEDPQARRRRVRTAPPAES